MIFAFGARSTTPSIASASSLLPLPGSVARHSAPSRPTVRSPCRWSPGMIRRHRIRCSRAPHGMVGVSAAPHRLDAGRPALSRAGSAWPFRTTVRCAHGSARRACVRCHVAAARPTGSAREVSTLIALGELEERRTVAAGPLRPLAASLAGDLSAAIDTPLYVPDEKALLSREGGRCPRDGTLLDFDPFAPHAHRCPRCREVYRGELHDRFWIYWYQLWLAERAVHGALLGVLGVEPRGTAFAASILQAYFERYGTYPNVDNALGPTRPFFSTYLESIWLRQLCVALDFIEASFERSAHAAIAGRFRDRVVEPSLALIQSYDEGMSNRQVWNNAAMMVANGVLGRADEAESVVWSESGLSMDLSDPLLPDCTWYG